MPAVFDNDAGELLGDGEAESNDDAGEIKVKRIKTDWIYEPFQITH